MFNIQKKTAPARVAMFTAGTRATYPAMSALNKKLYGPGVKPNKATVVAAKAVGIAQGLMSLGYRKAVADL